MATRPGLLVRAAVGYIRWLMAIRLTLPAVTRVGRDAAATSRSLHDRASVDQLGAEDADLYQDEQRHVVAMAAVTLMLILIGLAAAADQLGFGSLNRQLVACLALVGAGHVALLLWLTRRTARSGRRR